MRKFRFFIDLGKEEQYLNNMAKKGYILNNYSSIGMYTFMKSVPNDLHYKIDYRIFKKNEFEQYKSLFEDTGWVHVCGSKYSGAQFFLPSSSNLDYPDIFSDAESKAAPYKKIRNQFILGLIIILISLVAIFTTNGFKFEGYLTPGLWERTGGYFWFGFIFETPFVILRTTPLFFLLVLTVIYGYYAIKAYKLYKKNLKGNGNSCL